MFKLQRPINRYSKSSKERVDFKFSNFQALQVPKGWDRLFVSLVSVETGKPIAKLGKALAKNGSCQWRDTLSESIYIARDDSCNGYEECFVNLLVSTGSTRSTILGEVTINVSNYTSSNAIAAISLPLKKCTYGTILQVKIQCLTSRSKIGDDGTNSQEKDLNINHHEGTKSNGSDNSSDPTVGSRSPDLASISHPLNLDSKETSRSSTGSIQSFDSMEGSIGRKSVSTRSSLNNEEYNFSDDTNSPSNRSFASSREDIHNEMVVKRSSTTPVGSSRNLLEAAEDTIDQLRAEAKMWERNARKLMFDLDISRNELSDLSKKHKDLAMELSAVQSEILLQKELENEIKYQKDLSGDLRQQLKQSQESNIELVSFLQELEDSIARNSEENAKVKGDVQLLEEALREKTDELENKWKLEVSVKDEEIDRLKAKLSSNDNDSENIVDLVREVESLRIKVQELEKDCTELTDENLELLFKLKDSNKRDIRKSASFGSISSDSEVSDPKFQVPSFEDELKKNREFDFLVQHQKELEAEIRHMEDEKEFSLQEMDNCKSLATSLQHENEKLKQKSKDMQTKWIEAQEQCEYLHAHNEELHTCKKKLSDCARKVEYLEDRLTSVIEDFELKEKSVELEVDALVEENNHQKEKFDLELENLSRISLEASGEVSRLLSDNATLQASLQEVQYKLEAAMAESELHRKSEEKLKTNISDLELKLTISDYEREELNKEIDILKIQLQNVSGLHEEISIMAMELEGCKIEKDKLDNAFVIVCGDYEQLKAENITLSETISGFEECKLEKLTLEQKLVEMENELSVKENEKRDIENELLEIKKTNELGAYEERNERTRSSLEAELIDLKERYLEMSLKYAEVEGEREDLVMKLRATRSGKRWFS